MLNPAVSQVFQSGFAESGAVSISSEGASSGAQELEYFADSDYEDDDDKNASSCPVIFYFISLQRKFTTKHLEKRLTHYERYIEARFKV